MVVFESSASGAVTNEVADRGESGGDWGDWYRARCGRTSEGANEPNAGESDMLIGDSRGGLSSGSRRGRAEMVSG